MAIRWIVTDMDGTLLDSRDRISDRTKNCLLECQKKGIRLILASGRSYIRLLPYVHQLSMKEYDGCLIEINGLALNRLKTGERQVFAQLWEKEIQELFSFLSRMQVEIQGYEDESVYYWIPQWQRPFKIREREENGLYTSLRDFIYRLTSREINRRSLESFIKSGAMDCLPGTRKQKMLASMELVDQKNREKKLDIAGQLSLFDFMGEEDKKAGEVRFQDVGEYEKEELLAYEKEVLGIYISGHPLEKYKEKWKRHITARTTDFDVDDETGAAGVSDGQIVTIGGMITGKTVKTTKNNQLMAFITVEDMDGSVEVLIFPRDYEANRALLSEDAKVFVRGRVSLGDEAKGKLVCERIIPFDSVPSVLWLQFPDKAAWNAGEGELMELLADSDGNDQVGIFLKKERQQKLLGLGHTVRADEALLKKLSSRYGKENVKVVEKPIENSRRIQYN